jgi:hypothetical protein
MKVVVVVEQRRSFCALALVVSACNARDGFRQERARVKGEVKVGGVVLSFRALSSSLCDTALHLSASDGLG